MQIILELIFAEHDIVVNEVVANVVGSDTLLALR
jgi:hypothetical protein